MTDDNLHTPEGWHIVELEAEIERLRVAMQDAHDHLMNLQPHIAQLPKLIQPFIDSHVDCAMASLAKPPQQPREAAEQEAR